MAVTIFPALLSHPPKVKFQTQEEDEEINLLLRQHGITNLPWVIVATLGFILPFSLPLLSTIPNLNLGFEIPFNTLLGLIILWDMLIVAFALEKFLYWYFNIYLITNKHLIDITFYNLLKNDITEIRLSDIESISSGVTGVFGELFNFGNVTIETAAKTQTIQFIKIPQPAFVADRIQDLQEGQGKDAN